jgi:hypothetical protein
MLPGNVDEKELRARNLRMLGVLSGLFVLPLALAFWLYYGTDWRPGGHSNHGELITPVRPLPDAHPSVAFDKETAPAKLFRHKWSLVYIGDGQCAEGCRHVLYVMRQTRLSLNNEMSRVDRVFLVTSACCARDFLTREHPGLVVLNGTDGSADSLLSLFPTTDREQSVFVVDPLGNLMMQFDARQNPKGLLQDLKKLLSLSHIG